MKVIYIGHYRENNAFGESSRRYIHALRNIPNIELCIRPIFLQTIRLYNTLPDNILVLENNKCTKYDYLIQDTIPDLYEYNASFGKNIAVPKIQTRNLEHTGWIENLNMMDEVWVGSFFGEKSLRESGVTQRIKVIPEPFCLDNISNSIRQKIDNEYNFYTFSSMSTKDNLLNLLIAYNLEFSKKDNVRLIITLNNITDKEAKNIIEKAYHISKKPKNIINEPIIINGQISNEQKIDIHNNSDCYIDVSRGCFNGANCIEAALYNNIVVCTDRTAASSFITKNNGFNIDSSQSNIYCNDFSIYETWYDPSIESIMSNMRQAYDLTNEDRSVKLNKFNKNLFSHHQFKTYL